MKEANKKKEEKIKELQEFISRFSANASKSKQATSRKRALEKIQLDDMRPSSRKYPYIDFRPNREIGNEVLMVENLSKTIDGVKVLDNISFTLGHDDKVAFVGANEQAITTFSVSLSVNWSQTKEVTNGVSPLLRHIFQKTIHRNLTMISRSQTG